jgi:peptide deformylase
MLLEIVQYGHPTLRQKCRPVSNPSELQDLAKNMLETMYAADGVGLAAPQIDLPIQLICIDIPADDDSTTLLKVDGRDTAMSEIMPLAFVNPELEPYGPMESCQEGCLSVRNVRASVIRPTCVKATITLLSGKTITVECNGLLARCFQHECDHLNGVLFVERVSSAQRVTVKGKLRRLFGA